MPGCLHASLQDHIQCDHVADIGLALDSLCSQSLPRIIVVDLSVLTEQCRKRVKKLMFEGFFSAMPLIFIMDENDDEKWRWEFVQAGAMDVLAKPVSGKTLTAKIHALINLQIALEESVVQSMQNAVQSMMKSGHLLHEKMAACRRYEQLQSRYSLSFSEMKIVKLIDQGFVHKEIGEKLKLSENTVKNTAHQIYQKCYVNSKAELVELLHRGS